MFIEFWCDDNPDCPMKPWAGEPCRGEYGSEFWRNLDPSPNRLLKLLLPTVDAVEFRPLAPLGGVGGAVSSDRPPRDPMVDERPRMPRRIGPLALGEERAE
jgi:hypothetical protein